MPRTAIFYTPKYLNHNPGPQHPESPKRLKVILKELNNSGLLESGKCSLIEPEPANREDLKLIHEPDYIQLVEKISASGGGLLDLGDTTVSHHSFETALFAVGGILEAVDHVLAGEFKNAFALVRPPGHHAGPYYAMGFCLFNNVSIAATHLLEDCGLRRVLILDLDAHHGNGTQEIFYNTDKVLYISLHEDPTGFPGTGFQDEIGKGKGAGYTVNLSFPFGTDNEPYLRAFNQIAAPIIQQYKPQFILVSAGFDGHYTDPVAELSLLSSSYLKIFSRLLTLASELCTERLVAVLEGGYSLNYLGRLTVSVIAKMAGIPYAFQDEGPPVDLRARREAEKVTEDAKTIQSSFWKL